MGSTGLSTPLPGIDHFDIGLYTRNCITNTQKPAVARESKKAKEDSDAVFLIPGRRAKKGGYRLSLRKSLR